MFENFVLGLILGIVIAALTTILVMRARFRQEWAERLDKLRKDVANGQRRVIKGNIAEQLVPLMSYVFEYHPSDAHFIGDPIDYLIFDGYTDLKEGKSDQEITIVLAEVKSGKKGLEKRQRKIKEALEAGRMKWVTIRPLD